MIKPKRAVMAVVSVSPSSAATTMRWFNGQTYWFYAPSPGGCRNVTNGAPFVSVTNETGQGQIVYAGYNCTNKQEDGTAQSPQVLSPSVGVYKTDENECFQQYCEFRSYQHT